MRSSAALDSVSAAMPSGSTLKYRFDRPPRCGVGSANQECSSRLDSSRSSVASSAHRDPPFRALLDLELNRHTVSALAEPQHGQEHDLFELAKPYFAHLFCTVGQICSERQG